MISTNALSVCLLHHHLNGLGNKNLCLVQYMMRANEPSAYKFKKVCEDFPNIAILTNRSTPGEIKLTFVHAAIRNNSFGCSAVAFVLASNLSSPYVLSFKIEITFAADGDNINLLIVEVLLCAASGDLA